MNKNLFGMLSFISLGLILAACAPIADIENPDRVDAAEFHSRRQHRLLEIQAENLSQQEVQSEQSPTQNPSSKTSPADKSQSSPEKQQLEQTLRDYRDELGAEIYSKPRTLNVKSSLYIFALEQDYRSTPEFCKSVSCDFVTTSQKRLYSSDSRDFVSAIKMNGSGQTNSGKILSVHKITKQNFTWKSLNKNEAPYGMGASNCPIVPAKTLAVDPRLIPLNSLVYLPDTVNINNSGHDGIWYAIDIGGAIKQNRIDIHAGKGITSLRDFDEVNMQKIKAQIVGRLPKGQCPPI